MGFGSGNTFWKKIRNLRKYTDVDSFKFSEEYQGSTGWEYGFHTIYIDGSFHYSPIETSKEYERIGSRSLALEIDTQVNQQKRIVEDIVRLNGNVIKTIKYKGEKQIEHRNERMKSGKFKMGFLCHVHSHPQIQIRGLAKRIYTFYSRQDVLALMNSGLYLEGLITDKLWLLGKTNESILPEHSELQQATIAEANEPEKFIEIAGDTMSRNGFVLYVAEFGRNLVRIA